MKSKNKFLLALMLISSSINCSVDKSKLSFNTTNTNTSDIKAYVTGGFVRVKKEDSDSDSESQPDSDSEPRSDNIAHFMPVGDFEFDEVKEEGYPDARIHEGRISASSLLSKPLLSKPPKKPLPSIEESIDDEELMALILKEVKIEAGNSRSNSRLSSDLTPNKSCDSPTAQKQCTSPAFQRQLSSPTQKVSVLKKLDEKFHRDLLRRTHAHRVLGGVDRKVARLLTGDNS